MLQAFFVGRALAAAVSDRAEHVVSEGLSKLGKFDAEQREYFRQFTEEVMARAEQEKAAAGAMGENQLNAFRLIGVLLAIQFLFGLIFGGNSVWIAELAGFAIGFVMAPVLVPGGFMAAVARLRDRS